MRESDVIRRTDTVETGDGPVRGTFMEGMRQFLGIPYAAPPVGALRWRPPQPPLAWPSPRDVVHFGPVCAQGNISIADFGYFSESEDCLYLNVFTSEAVADGHRRPVMVWIHGGGLIIGGSTGYDPGALVRDGDVILVTLNYRVNLFGFFSHPAINAEQPLRGNFGILDQQFALKWVRTNIAAFGGDPDNVTIFGESAGGMSVWSHIVSPGSAGLFHKAIVFSGSCIPTSHMRSLQECEAMGTDLATAAGCTEQTSDKLRLIPTGDLLNANSVPPWAFSNGNYNFSLMVDGVTIPEPIAGLLGSGRFNRVPLINGTCHDEFFWFQGMIECASGQVLDAENYPRALKESFAHIHVDLIGSNQNETRVAEILKRYPLKAYSSPSAALATAIGDSGLICSGGRRATRIVSKFVENVYAFEFFVPDSPSPWPAASFKYEAAHTLELQYIFPGFCGGGGASQRLTGEQQRLARQMLSYFTSFAAHGVPNGPGSATPSWPVYDADEDNYLVFRTPEPVVVKGFGTTHQCDFWDSITE